MTRTRTLRGASSPTGAISPVSRARRRAGCTSRGSSPISSRKSVPWSAAANAPRRASTAPVNAPRRWPKRTLATSSRAMAPQLSGTNGPPETLDPSWMARTTSSLPTPDSPDHEARHQRPVEPRDHREEREHGARRADHPAKRARLLRRASIDDVIDVELDGQRHVAEEDARPWTEDRAGDALPHVESPVAAPQVLHVHALGDQRELGVRARDGGGVDDERRTRSGSDDARSALEA